MVTRLSVGVIAGCLFANAPAFADCVPTRGFVDTRHPMVEPASELDSHSEDIVIARPLPVVLNAVFSMSLSQTVHKTNALPGITGTYLLTKATKTFGAVGSRQFDCLSDGSTLEEESLERSITARDFHFRYVVWNYTSEAAHPIRYGIGDFEYHALDATHTSIHWTYSFALDRSRFPGYLGGLGDFLFRVTFLDWQYAELMKGVLRGYERAAETPTARGS